MNKKHEHIVKCVKEGSIAEELEIEVGDKLLEINNEVINDIFDYHYMVNDEYLEVLVEKADGEEWLLEIEKDEDEDLGIEFETSLMDEYRSCRNKCIFCFIDQNPPDMRETIYFKDDDSRLSFLQGNYITLTNMSDEDVDRIIKYKLAPINISVHTTNPELRCKMLNNRFAGDALSKIKKFYDAGIIMNGQIVLCKGVNDGGELDNTISDLMKYMPHMQSVSVVPVGLSKYREGLSPLEPFNKEDSQNVIDIVSKYQALAFEEYGTHFIHASDEWYINAGIEVPNEESYDGYVQIENGVGMVRSYLDEIRYAIEDITDAGNKDMLSKDITVSTLSGLLAYDYVCQAAKMVEDSIPNVKVNVYPITNNFFGERITVTGLLTGKDITEQIKGKELGEKLIIPNDMLKADEDIFLDDMTLEEFQKALQVQVAVVQSNGVDFVNEIFRGEK